MTHYFGAFAALAAPLLALTAWTGIARSPSHLSIGLFASILTVAAHSLLILFMIVTGRLLREATRARALGPEFLRELNAFFAKRAGYPLALFSVLAIATAAVLGYGQRAFGFHPALHMLIGLGALVLNLWTFTLELGVLRENQRLIDGAVARLDRIDRELELEQRGKATATDGAEPYEPQKMIRLGWSVALGAWLPFLYILFVVWRGDLTRVSLHPWLEFSLVGVALLVLAYREPARKRPS